MVEELKMKYMNPLNSIVDIYWESVNVRILDYNAGAFDPRSGVADKSDIITKEHLMEILQEGKGELSILHCMRKLAIHPS